MEIGEYLRIFRRFWWLVLVIALAGVAVGYGSTFVTSAKYQSTARLFVTTQSGTSVGDAYQNNLFSQERVVSYAGLATSEQVAIRAADQLRSTVSADDLRSKITATPVPNTVLLDVTATDSNAASAQSYANAVSDQLVQLVSELETSRRGGTPAAGAILVDEAGFPTTSTAPGLLTRLALGAVGGLALGIVAALAAGLLDSRIRRRERVEEVSGSLVLGALVKIDGRREGQPVDMPAGGVAVERLRELRTNLQFARTADGSHPHVIAVTSAAAGDGRSTTAVDLAACLAETGKSVLLVDGDFLSSAITDRVGLTDPQREVAVGRGLSTVLAGFDSVDDAIIPNAGGARWALLPSGPTPSARGGLWAGDAASAVLKALRADYDFVLIDTPPLLAAADGARVASLADGAIVIARIGQTKLKALRRAVQVLLVARAQILGAVVNDEPGHRRELAHINSVDQTANTSDDRGEVGHEATPTAGDDRSGPVGAAHSGAHRVTQRDAGSE